MLYLLGFPEGLFTSPRPMAELQCLGKKIQALLFDILKPFNDYIFDHLDKQTGCGGCNFSELAYLFSESSQGKSDWDCLTRVLKVKQCALFTVH